MSPNPSPVTDPVVAARRELHELTVLSSALLRLATKVQARCDALRHTLGDLAPLDEEEVDLHAPRGVGAAAASAPAPADGESASPEADDEDPAVLLAMSLASEGMSREQIAEYLEHSFGMEQTDELLDRVLPEQD